MLSPNRVTEILESGGDLWLPELTAELVSHREIELQKASGPCLDGYSTSGFLGDQALQILTLPTGNNQLVNLEILAPKVEAYFELKGVRFYSPDELKTPVLIQTLKEAFNLIALTPTLCQSVSVLVKSLHLLIPPDVASDVSFSEPEIPFSIFVSMPYEAVEWRALRVAEAIIHEAMHLQLSLVERIVPLVDGEEEVFYSPWKQVQRKTAGLLHALYVFAIIDSWLEKISLLSDGLYVDRRRSEIKSQISQNSLFAESADLTSEGRALSWLIFSRFRSHPIGI